MVESAPIYHSIPELPDIHHESFDVKGHVRTGLYEIFKHNPGSLLSMRDFAPPVWKVSAEGDPLDKLIKEIDLTVTARIAILALDQRLQEHHWRIYSLHGCGWVLLPALEQRVRRRKIPFVNIAMPDINPQCNPEIEKHAFWPYYQALMSAVTHVSGDDTTKLKTIISATQRKILTQFISYPLGEIISQDVFLGSGCDLYTSENMRSHIHILRKRMSAYKVPFKIVGQRSHGYKLEQI